MRDSIADLLEHDALLSRRRMLQTLAGTLAVSAIARPAFAMAGSERALPPFEPTGWRTVWLDHLNYNAPTTGRPRPSTRR